MDRDTLSMQLDPEILMHLMQQQLASGGAMPPGMPPGVRFQMSGDTAPNSNGAAAASGETDGRSRQYRSGGWECTGSLAGVPRDLIHTPNPVVPLKFEQPPGQWEALTVITTEAHNMPQFEEHFVSPQVMKAHLKALEAYGRYTWQEAVQTAQEALSISPICPEAYNVLAVAQANSYEEALENYRKAVDLGPKILLPYCFEDMQDEHTCWQRTPFRAYYRGLYGVANTLRKMGKYSESLSAYDKLLKADPSWYSWSSYVNVMALYPFVLLGAKGPKAVIQYMRDYGQTEEQFTYMSSSTYWAGAYLLADLMITEEKGSSRRAEGAKVAAEDGWAADGLDLPQMPPATRAHEYRDVKTRPLFCFCHTFFEAVDFLLGDKALPSGLTTNCSGGSKTMTAASLAYTTGAQWRKQPAVLQRLRRYRNTYEVRALIQDLRTRKPKVDLQELRQYMTAPGGFHTGALERDMGTTPRVLSTMYHLMDHPDGREFNKEELKVLKWLIDAGVPVTDTHTPRPADQPLHMACYQGYGPEAVKLLLAAGADPLQQNVQGLTALAMTGNQGNWREMQALLQGHPHLKTANAAAVKYCPPNMWGSVSHKKLTVPEAVLLELFQTTCLFCLAGGEKCMRCSNGIPHSKYADFFKYAEVLVAEADIRKLPKPVLDEIQSAARQTGPGSPWTRLQAVILRAVDKQRKAPPVQQQPAAAAAAPAGPGAAANSPSKSSSTSKGATNGSNNAKPPQHQQQQQQQTQPQAAPTQPSAPSVRQCWECGLQPGPDETLQKCSGCKRALYCSRACQEAAWKGHKADCKQWGAERAAAKAKAKK